MRRRDGENLHAFTEAFRRSPLQHFTPGGKGSYAVGHGDCKAMIIGGRRFSLRNKRLFSASLLIFPADGV